MDETLEGCKVAMLAMDGFEEADFLAMLLIGAFR
jgi:hypothetical protein